MKKIFILSSFLLFFSFSAVLAHQPVLVSNNDLVEVRDPEISKAYYGELSGEPFYYEIVSDEPFLLYINILVPDIDGIDKDVSVDVYKKQEGYLSEVFSLDGGNFDWEEYYEPYGGDSYFKGPENEVEVEAGKYLVEVYSDDNEGKYVLAVGKEEKFSLKDILRTIYVLPKLKSQFFFS